MKKRIAALFFITVALVIFLVSCAESEPIPDSVSVSLSKKGDELTVRVMPESELLETHKDSKLYLFALAPGQTDADIVNLAPIAEAASGESVSFKLPLIEKGISKLYYSFTAAFVDSTTGGYVKAVASPGYINNPEVLSQNDKPYTSGDTIKGLNVVYDNDAVALDIEHAVIEIAVEDYLLGIPNSESISYIFGGESFYLDRAAIETLDDRVSYYTQNDINVYFRFVLKTGPDKLAEKLRCLANQGAVDDAEYYAINMRDERAAAYMAGLLDFMAARYTRADGQYGLCANFIAGHALNSPEDGIGDASREQNMISASILVRTMQLALTSHYKNGRVFAAVDNHWKNVTAGGSGDSASYNFLTDFAARAAASGDYPWGIAMAVSATSSESDRIWYDDSGNGRYITPTNIATITGVEFLGQENMLYAENPRNMIVSDFSVELNDTEISTELQASSYAYAYYKFYAAGNIDAVIYSDQVDRPNAKTGLRPVDDQGAPGRARRAWFIMRDIDGDADIDSTVSQYIKENSWTELYRANSAAIRVKKTRTGTAAVGVMAEDYNPSTLYSFDNGTTVGFTACGDKSWSGLVRVGASSSFEAWLPPLATGLSYISRPGIKPAELNQNTLLITLCLSPEPGGTAAYSYDLVLTLSQKNGRANDPIYRCEVDAIAPGAPVTLAFDIGAFREVMLDGDIELRLSAVGLDGSGCLLRIDSIMSGQVQKHTWMIVMLILLAVLALAGIVVLGILWYRKQSENGDPHKSPFGKKTDDESKEERKAKKEEKKKARAKEKKAKKDKSSSEDDKKS